MEFCAKEVLWSNKIKSECFNTSSMEWVGLFNAIRDHLSQHYKLKVVWFTLLKVESRVPLVDGTHPGLQQLPNTPSWQTTFVLLIATNRYWQHTRNMIHTYFIKYLITEIGSWPPFNTTHRETHQWSYKTVIVNNTGQATRVLWGVFMWTVRGRRQEGCGVSRVDVWGWLATWTPTNTSRPDTGTCHWPACN